MNGHSPHATDAHVLAAAAALREFTLNEITAVCDATPSAIVEILATAGNAVPPVGSADPLRWRVRDVTALRRMIRAGRRGDDPPPSPSVLAGDADLLAVRLRHAEDLLARCGAEPSPTRRRSMVIAAVNHLRQVVAEALPDTPPWWTVELTGGRVDDQIRWHGEGAISHRLSFDIVVARLAVGNAAGVIVPTADLIDTVISVRHTVASIDDHCLPALVRGFVELVTAQLAVHDHPCGRPIGRRVRSPPGPGEGGRRPRHGNGRARTDGPCSWAPHRTARRSGTCTRPSGSFRTAATSLSCTRTCCRWCRCSTGGNKDRGTAAGRARRTRRRPIRIRASRHVRISS